MTCKHVFRGDTSGPYFVEATVGPWVCPWCDNERLRGEIESLRADAERYRWLRSWDALKTKDGPWCVHWVKGPPTNPGTTNPMLEGELDAAVDAARAREEST